MIYKICFLVFVGETTIGVISEICDPYGYDIATSINFDDGYDGYDGSDDSDDSDDAAVYVHI